MENKTNDINILLDKILVEFKSLNPKFCRECNDPRIDTYYISLSQTIYIVLNGICDYCDSISINKIDNFMFDITFDQGLYHLANGIWNDEDLTEFNDKLLYELTIVDDETNELIDENYRDVDYVVSLIKNKLKEFIDF